MDIWNQVESVTQGDDVFVRCTVCGEVLERITLLERLQDQGFPRRVHQTARNHLPSCPGASKARRETSQR